MPAPRAVLHDLHEQGMDPSTAHSHLGKDGRLVNLNARPSPAPIARPALMKLPVPKAPTLPTIVAAPVKEEPKVEAALMVEEAPAAVVEKQAAAVDPATDETVILASSKKLRAKKAEKPTA